jgi:hypothetical protein
MASASKRSTTELAIAEALQKAAAGSSSSGGLCIRSCRLAGAGLNSAAILQALPGSCLTSLRLDMRTPVAAASDIHALMGRLAGVLPSLQQLQELHFFDCFYCNHKVAYNAVISGFGALTNLTSLTLPEVGASSD